MKNIKLRNGIEIPPIGFGSYKIPAENEGAGIIVDALKAGYRLIDTATMYKNEDLVGEGLRRAFGEGIATRGQVTVTTKVANPDRGYDSTMRAFDKSLKELGLDRIDLYLIHWPASEAKEPNWRNINSDTWRALETLYKDGRVRAIGVSNFMPVHLEALSETATILPMVNQIEFHPGFMQRDVLEWCDSHEIVVEGWSPLGRTRVLTNPLLEEIAERLGRSVAQICLRWAVQHSVVPIPKSLHYDRMKENIDIFDFSLSPEDMAAIDSMPRTGESGLNPDTITF
ncbi:MAG: aldo/keto reductase [Bacteroidales bacterium]|nr:aldo/keto reductase [Bacteroidales bacterium]MBD5223522.1 aldo/keto reductase [Bacteroidales bacterium]MBD5302497.1 aldo/keto reductase [Bacteroides sp.]